MIKLERFFEMHFDDQHISRHALRTFLEDHLQRLTAQNSEGHYTRMIKDTEQVYRNSAKSNSRTAMELQLRRNLIQLALQNPGNSAAAGIFFDESILRHPQQKEIAA